MTHTIDMVLDLQYGSTGKGLIAGYLAKRNNYDTAICAFATNAGHTYIDESRGIRMMTQQLPTAICSPTVRNVMIGPGAAIHAQTIMNELKNYERFMDGKRLMIHPHAVVVEDYHADSEVKDGRTKMGSTAKGVGDAYIERIRRHPTANVAVNRWKNGHPLEQFVVTPEQYRDALEYAEQVIVEGAQGYSLSMYHGQYPFTTSRDVTPWQVAADCGLPYKWAAYVNVVGTLRTYPIRVSNRDGSSGPCYPDQREIAWNDIGVDPELTTVTKLPRRIFTFSQQQLTEALFHCGGYWKTSLFLNFANYTKTDVGLMELIRSIQMPKTGAINAPAVVWLGFGPDDKNVMTLEDYMGSFDVQPDVS